MFHAGALEFPAAEQDHHAAICSAVPTIVDATANRSGDHRLRSGLLDVRPVTRSPTKLYHNGPLLSATENH
jgi:hypothetical protein